MNLIKRCLVSPLAWGLLSFAVLATLSAPWALPGQDTLFLTRALGIWEIDAAISHPLVTLLFRAIAPLVPEGSVSIAGCMNLLTAGVAAFCVSLLTLIMRKLFRVLTHEDNTRPFLERVEAFTLPVAACALLLSPVFLRAGTAFTLQTFDLLLLLSAALLALRVMENGSAARMGTAFFVTGLLVFESPATLLTVPLLSFIILAGYITARDRLEIRPFLTAGLLPAAGGALLTLLTIGALGYQETGSAELFPLIAVTVKRLILETIHFGALPWVLIILSCVLPGILQIFLCHDICRNRRSPAILFVLITLSVLAFCAFLPTPLSVTRLTEDLRGASPLLLAVLTAFALACSCGNLVLMRCVTATPEACDERAGIRRFGRRISLLLIPALVLLLIGGGAYHAFRHLSADRHLADLPRAYADTILDRMEKETWLLGDGISDPLLALRIRERNLPIVFFSLSQDHREETLEALRSHVETGAPFSGNPELQAELTRALDIGMIPFIQDWMRLDKSALDHFVTLALPDLWFTGNALPLPELLWYRGAADRTSQIRKLPAAGAQAIFPPEALDAAPEAAADLTDFAAYVRRQAGFVSNNLGFFLADSGKMEEAFALFTATYAYDPDNVSALFNIFELIHDGLHEEQKTWCEEEIEKLIKTLSGRKYRLWALARTYGYIRSPQLISALAGSWAMSGQTGAALSGMDLALEMLDDGQRNALQGSIAALYTMTPGKRREAIALYRELLSKSTNQKQSLSYLRELIRMTILEGDLAAAETLLVQAESLAGKAEMGHERALYASTAGDPARARIALQSFLELHPKHIDALALLATIQMSMDEFDAIRTTTLPKLLTAAGTEDNYFIQIVMARLAEIDKDLKKARAAYLRALALKPEVTILRTTILALDIRLNDRAAAEQHAKRFLYQDRKLPLANYIMGALALQEDDLKRAESYLLTATDREVSPPLPEAFNDLAETYRRQGKWAPALATAQQAYTYASKLACAHETAAAALFEMGRYAEAEAELATAIKLDSELNPAGERDASILLTQARLQTKQGQTELARVTLAALQKQVDKLSKQNRLHFDELMNTLHGTK